VRSALGSALTLPGSATRAMERSVERKKADGAGDAHGDEGRAGCPHCGSLVVLECLHIVAEGGDEFDGELVFTGMEGGGDFVEVIAIPARALGNAVDLQLRNAMETPEVEPITLFGIADGEMISIDGGACERLQVVVKNEIVRLLKLERLCCSIDVVEHEFPGAMDDCLGRIAFDGVC